ncbi:MAG: EAL domain-containing protein [Gemmatimonadaceae bacterium]|nr:EAL domain-containing protein [Gemmatimonadaceae bacterium]
MLAEPKLPTPPSQPAIAATASSGASAAVGLADRALERSTRVFTVMGLLVIALLIGIAAVTALGRVPVPALSSISNATLILALVAGVVPIALLLVDLRVPTALRRSWFLIGVAFASLAIGHVGEHLEPGTAAHRAADVLHLAFHPLLFFAVVTLPCGLRTHTDRARLMLDVLVTAGAVTTLTLALVPAEYGTVSIGAVRVPGLATILGDGTLIAAAAMLWLRGAVTSWRDPLAPIAAASVLHVVAQFAVGALPLTWAAQLGEGLLVAPFAFAGLAAARHRASLIACGVLCGTTRRMSFLPTIAACSALLVLIVTSLTPSLEVADAAIITASVVGLAAITRQILGLRGELAEREQAASEQADRRLAALVKYGSDMLSIVDPDTTVRYASPSHKQVMGVDPETLIGKPLMPIVHRDDVDASKVCFARLVSRESMHESIMVRFRDIRGEWRWIEAVATNLIDEPSIGGIVLNSRDVTQRKALEDQLLEQALLDPLTKLGNRRLFGDRVSHALARRVRRSSDVALLLLDLDHFKFVNDTLGHAMGDALLIAVANRLRTVLRQEDTIARLGGDEFAILLEDLDGGDEAEATAARIQQVLERPFTLADREIFVRASVGIAWATDGQDVDELLTDADVAMYSAKSAGRGRTERYSSEMRATVAERLEVEADLRHALQRNELHLQYQPVIDLTTGHVCGAEALIRWRHPEKGIMLPLRFISVAEESDLIIEIGKFVLAQAGRDVLAFRAANPQSARMRVGVNLSARHFLAADLIPDVQRVMAENNIPGSALAIELTESALASNEPIIAERLQGLRDLGLRIALDDFGTGYSSLAYLRRFPIDMLKIDKSFVSYNAHDIANDGVTKAIISIGHSLNMRTVAEGVETMDQLRQLRELGCALGQGYLFAPPLGREAFISCVQSWDSNTYAAPSTAHRAVA